MSKSNDFNRMRMAISRIIHSVRVMLYRFKGYDIDKAAKMERGLNLDRINPAGIHVGADTIITSNVTILSHYLHMYSHQSENGETRVYYSGEKCDTWIGKGCVIGIGATIVGGVRIGDFCIVGAGSVVTKDVQNNTIVAGNPAKIIKENVTLDGIKV